MSAKGGITALKQILLDEEQKKFQELDEKILHFQEKVADDFVNLKIPDKEVDELIHHITLIMPEKLGPAITKTLSQQIKESRDEVVQVLYPIIGQMIKKYIQQEIQILSDRIDAQLDTIFSWEKIKQYILSLFGKGSVSSELIRNAVEPQIQEIFLIENDSGLLLGSYSRQKTLDQDMIAGMLTAIRAFVNDAFSTKEQTLETIEYDLYKIYIQGFPKFYIAVVISGVITTEFKSKLDDTILKFVREMASRANGDSFDAQEIASKLELYFQESQNKKL